MNTEIEFLAPWVSVGQLSDILVKELEREVSENHVLWNLRSNAIAQRSDNDDVLFDIEGSAAVAVVHLTWSGKKELDGRFPETRIFQSFDAWREKCMNVDNAEIRGID